MKQILRKEACVHSNGSDGGGSGLVGLVRFSGFGQLGDERTHYLLFCQHVLSRTSIIATPHRAQFAGLKLKPSLPVCFPCKVDLYMLYG